MTTIGQRLKSARAKCGFTLDELAKAANTTKQTIYKYENDIITNIPNDKLEKICDYLKISPAWLMGWSNVESETDIYGINKQEMLAYLSKHNPELLDTYKHITDNENLSLLFDAAKDLTPEDLAPILAIIQNIRKAKGIE